MPSGKVGDSARVQGPTTNRIRRHELATEASIGNFAPSALVPAPPPLPPKPPRSLGDHSSAPAAEIEHGTVSTCARYDLYEKVWSEELPYLFQTVFSGSPRAMSSTTVWRLIRDACDELTSTHPEFADVRFSPHDFRRLFATELVNNGLPIHIGAALLGHLDIRTMRGYVAVFDEDVISSYQQFLARRRAERPIEEYREPTPEEWNEFNEHFDKRRVELGSCGRPYGTPCQHEHAPSAARCSRSTPRCCRGSMSWRRICWSVGDGLSRKAGGAKSKASTSRSRFCAANEPRPSA